MIIINAIAQGLGRPDCHETYVSISPWPIRIPYSVTSRNETNDEGSNTAPCGLDLEHLDCCEPIGLIHVICGDHVLGFEVDWSLADEAVLFLAIPNIYYCQCRYHPRGAGYFSTKWAAQVDSYSPITLQNWLQLLNNPEDPGLWIRIATQPRHLHIASGNWQFSVSDTQKVALSEELTEIKRGRLKYSPSAVELNLLEGSDPTTYKMGSSALVGKHHQFNNPQIHQ